MQWWLLSTALATQGRASAADPFRKSFRVLGFSRFSGFGVGKKRVKFEDAFWRSLLGVFWSIFGPFLVDFWSIFYNFLVLSTRKNRVIYNVFCAFGIQKKLLTTCRKTAQIPVFFARPGPQNTVNTVIFARRGSKPRKYRGFALARSQKHRYLRCFFVPRM